MNRGTCPNSLSICCFHLTFTFESIKELGSASNDELAKHGFNVHVLAYVKDELGVTFPL